MGDVIHIHQKRAATDHEKAQVFLKILKAASRYIEHAQVKGVYKDWKQDGRAICSLIDRLVLQHEDIV